MIYKYLLACSGMAQNTAGWNIQPFVPLPLCIMTGKNIFWTVQLRRPVNFVYAKSTASHSCGELSRNLCRRK